MATAKKNATDPPVPAAPKAADKGPNPNETVLVFLARLGPYSCTYTKRKEGEEAPVGAGATDPVSRMTVEPIVVPPGLYLLDPVTWGKVSPNDGFQSLVRKQVLLILSDDPKRGWGEQWREVRVRRAIEYITDSTHVPTLQAILKIDDRADIQEAIGIQLGKIATAPKERQLAPNPELAHAVSGARSGRSRSASMLGG